MEQSQPPAKRGRKPKAAQQGTAPGRKPKAAEAANSQEALEDDQAPTTTGESKIQGTFEQPLMMIMHAHGDDRSPLQDTVSLLEDIVIEYSTKMLHTALDRSLLRSQSLKGKSLPHLTAKDFLELVEGDPLKYGRLKEIIATSDLIKKYTSGTHGDFVEQGIDFGDEKAPE